MAQRSIGPSMCDSRLESRDAKTQPTFDSSRHGLRGPIAQPLKGPGAAATFGTRMRAMTVPGEG